MGSKLPVWEQLATDQFDPWQVVPRQVFIPSSCLFISTVLVVISPVGCLRIFGVRFSPWRMVHIRGNVSSINIPGALTVDQYTGTIHAQIVFSLVQVHVPYFFGYKTVFLFLNNPKDLDPSYKMDLDFWGCSILNNPKNLDPSYKMDLDLWDCLGRVKLVL